MPKPACSIPDKFSSTPVLTEPSPPIRVELSMSRVPKLGKAEDLIFTVSSIRNAANITATITLPEGAVFTDDTLNSTRNLSWHCSLNANESATFTYEIMFTETGKWSIEGSAGQHTADNPIPGDLDIIYLTIGTTKSEFGWPPSDPVVPVQQIEEGDADSTPSNQEEPPIEDRPPPPAVDPQR
jgi:hypothetical protein